MTTYSFSHQAYVKIILHTAKYPHKSVNGVLLGSKSSATVNVVDAIPLLHLWTSLSPMMEIGLELARVHAKSQNLSVVGYYQSSDRVNDCSLGPVGERVTLKIQESFQDAAGFVVDNSKLSTQDSALIPYTFTNGVWRTAAASMVVLQNPVSPQKALSLVRDKELHKQLGDFDDHLEDVRIDWLRNPSCAV